MKSVVNSWGDSEVTEDVLKSLYGDRVLQAIKAISVDPAYATEILTKARSIQARRARREQRLAS